MSESIEIYTAVRPDLVPQPSGPATGTLSAGTPGGSMTRARASDGSITITVSDALGDIVAFASSRPDHPLSMEA